MYRDVEQRDFARRLRHAATPAERRLWKLLRAEQFHGYKFRRQAAIGSYIVDFVCFAAKVIVELDGPQHMEQAARLYDAERTRWLQSQGFRVFRFPNHRLDNDVHLVLDDISRALDEPSQTTAPPPSPALPTRGRGPEVLGGGGRDK